MLSSTTDINNYMKLCQDGFFRGDKPVRLLGLGIRLQSPPPALSAEESNQLSLTLDLREDEEAL